MSSFLSQRQAARLLFHPSTPLFPSFRSSFSHPFLQPSRHFFHVPRRLPVRLARHPRTVCSNRSHTEQNVQDPPAKLSVPEKRLRTPYDLVNFRRSRFVAHLNELSRRSSLPPNALPDPPSRLDRALTSAGIAHEDRVVSHLLSVVSTNLDLPPSDTLFTVPPGKSRYDLTSAAINARVPLIRSAALRDDTFAGVADVLLLASADPFASPSQRARAREGTYVVCEVKLASTCTADYALQAAAYACMLAKLQGEARVPSADWAYIWVGSPERPPKQVSLRSLLYLFDRTRQDFTAFLSEFREEELPEPDGPLDRLSPWKEFAQHLLEEKDSLSLIAGIRRSQATQIEDVLGVKTLEAFADLDSDVFENAIRKYSWHSMYRSLHKQAKMQRQTRRNGGKPTAFELIRSGTEPFLPPHSDADMFFDMEGFPLMEHGGLEYLFGLEDGEGKHFKFWWAHSREDEEKSFIQLMRCIQNGVERERTAGRTLPHIFHYGHYEVTALRRVALRATTAQGIEASNILDELLQHEMFVDVYKVVISSIIVGEPSYSIKQVEKLVGISREDDDLADAESSVGMYYEWRRKYYFEDVTECTTVDAPLHPILEEILSYNQQDCKSLREVVSWLRAKLPRADNVPQAGLAENLTSPIRSESSYDSPANIETEDVAPGACGPTHEHKLADSVAIRRSLELSQVLLRAEYDGLSLDVRRTLSHLLQYYVRESNPARMQFSDRIKLASGPNYKNLLDDDQCISGVSLISERLEGVKKKKKLFVYDFPKGQPSMLASGNSAAFVVPQSSAPAVSGKKELTDISCFVTVKGVEHGSRPDRASLTLSAGRNLALVPPSFGVLVSGEDLKVCDAPLRQSLLRITEKLFRNKSDSSVSLALAYLQRSAIDEEPFNGIIAQQFQHRDTRRQDVTKFLASRKLSCVFVVQGPPGSGKTSLSAEIIRDLVMRHKKTVAVSSNSHAAVDNLLSSAIRAGCHSSAVWKIGIRSTQSNVDCFKSNLRDLKVAPFSASENESGKSAHSSSTSLKSGSRKKEKQSGALVGATCYQLSRVEAEGMFDFLFVDEASQVPIPNFMSMSTSSKYAVLVGDQQQLEMPIKGTHPEVLEQSCLSFIVGKGVTTVPSSRGIFLEKSYRMNPDICRFVSESFYDHALSPALNCMENKVQLELPEKGHPRLLSSGSGIVFVPCDVFAPDTFENTTKSSYGKWHRPAEVRVISNIIGELLGVNCIVNGSSRSINVNDILVVAPYNAQVRALKEVLPEGVRVGTVDKFQGQEAPVALISTCASKLPDSPSAAKYSGSLGDEEWGESTLMTLNSSPSRTERRGLRFSVQKNRLNVAISRAQCLAVVTGDTGVFSTMPLTTLEDIDCAALYEDLVHSCNR